MSTYAVDPATRPGSDPAAPIRLDGSELTEKRHVCGFFRDPDEQYRVLLPYIQEGLDNGERAFHIVDPEQRDQHLRRLQDAGIDVASAVARGALDVISWPDAHLRGDRFDQDRMLELIQEVLTAGRPAFPLTRFIANMEWALTDAPGVGDIVEYEARLNEVLPRFIDPVICTYDLARFSAGVVIDMMRTHPMAVIGSTLYENPYYVSPDELRAELRERRQPAVN